MDHPELTVDAESRYVEKESDPANNRFLFAYTITITNHGKAGAQLLNRHWFITNGSGEVDEVEGPGVVGKQPHLEPGASFRYTSAVILETPVGSMNGNYEFQTGGGERFRVSIPVFSLSVPNLVH